MKFINYLNEIKSEYGKGITFIDIDNTIFYTFANVKVVNDETGEVVKILNAHEFNTYKLPPGHSFDTSEFSDAEIFRKTSIPIDKTINRIKKMFKNIKRRNSKVILLTARPVVKDMKTFKKKFKEHGIPIEGIEIKFASKVSKDMKPESLAVAKKNVIFKYLKTGEYRRVRLIDDSLSNVKQFLSLENEIPKSIINKVKKKHNITDDENLPVIQFFGLHVNKDGSLTKLK